MENIIYRIRNCFTLSNGTACSVGAGVSMISIFAPIAFPNVSRETALYFFYVGIGLVAIGLVMAVWRYIKNPIEKRLKIYSIVTVLDKMYRRLELLADKEEHEKIDWENFSKTAGKINRFAGVVVPVISTLDEARDKVQNLEKDVSDILPKSKKRTEKISWILSLSRLLDKDGFGLKEKRKGDNKYNQLLKMVDKYYDDYKDLIDNKLRVLIRSYIEFAESATNFLLFLQRTDTMLKLASDLGISNLLPPSMEVGMEGSADDMREIARDIRVEIGQYIKKLENARTTKIK